MGALPFESGKGFTAMPSVIFTLYTKHPKFNPTAMAVYGYLIQRYNANFGYAFPSQTEIAQTLHISDSTVKRAISVLRDLELIKVERNPEYNNNIYRLLKPIENETAFIAKFPEVVEAEEKHEETWDKINEQRKEAKERHLEKKGAKPAKKEETPVEKVEVPVEVMSETTELAEWF